MRARRQQKTQKHRREKRTCSCASSLCKKVCLRKRKSNVQQIKTEILFNLLMRQPK